MGRIKNFSLIGLMFTTGTTMAAPVKPNFTGHWQLSIQESRNIEGKPLPYAEFNLILVHNEPSLYVVQEIRFGPKKVRKLRFPATTDGKQHLAEGTRAWSWWEGNTLVVRYWGERPKNAGAVEVVRRMRLDADGATMHADTEFRLNGHLQPNSGSEVWRRSLEKTSP